MKKLVTFRFDADVLAVARQSAQRENRSLTNFIETILKQALSGSASDASQAAPGDRP